MIVLTHCIPYRNRIPFTYRLHINRNPTSVILGNPYVNTLFIAQSQIRFCTQTIQHGQNQMLTCNTGPMTIFLFSHNQYICILFFIRTNDKRAVYRKSIILIHKYI